MTTSISLTPLFGASVGFDRFAGLIDRLAQGVEANPGYPPYDINRSGEDRYLITLSVPGFIEKDLQITAQNDQLVVAGRKAPTQADTAFVYKGIAMAAEFQRVFQLADYMVVSGAELKDGLLRIELVREVPEALRPRKIDIRLAGNPRPVEPTQHQAAA